MQTQRDAMISISGSISGSIARSRNRSTADSLDRSLDHSLGRSLDRPRTQALNGSIIRSQYRWVAHRSITQSVARLIFGEFVFVAILNVLTLRTAHSLPHQPHTALTPLRYRMMFSTNEFSKLHRVTSLNRDYGKFGLRVVNNL